MTTKLQQNQTCAECGEQECGCPERQKDGTWKEHNLERKEIAADVRNWRASKSSMEIYRERHAPLLHIEHEASQDFFTPVTKAIIAYRERTHAAYSESPSRRRPWFTLLLALTPLLIAAQIHA